MLSGRSLFDELITRPEESYRLCCVVVYDLETSRVGAPYIYDISRLRVKPLEYSEVQRLKVAILPLDLPCSGPITHSGEILSTGNFHEKKPDRFSLHVPRVMKRYSPTGRRNYDRSLRRLLDT